ncbi:MAG: WG repeat-containing protein [Clostridiaceae bacterium]|nr:WG repeat-containing protein [Clostridiaceae bacterium]
MKDIDTGYISNNSDSILDVEYNEINRITEINSEKEIYLLAFKNGQAGIYKNKEQVLKHNYEEIEYNKTNEVFIVQKKEKQGVISKEGKEILKSEYDYIIISGDKINAEKDQILYIYDMNGNKQNIETNTTLLSTDNEQYFITINEQEKFGVIDNTGKTIIENKYQYIEYAFGDYFIATNEGKVGVIDKDQNIKIDFSYNVIQKIKDTNILQAIMPSNNISDIYNSNLEKIISMKDATIIIENDYIKLLSIGERKYFDKNGKELNNKEIFTNSKLFAFNKDEKWGFVDSEENIKVDVIYDMVTELNNYGFAGIKKDGKWGVINDEGKIIVEPSYEVEWNEPEFIGEYLKLNFGYGFCYYTKQINNQ